tara:strand:+ start:6217 stop:6858 length:642 start_codon:yes stop_codon:yes gene_type:complete
MKYYSQYQQDEIIFERFFKSQTKGFFLDIGAMDGIHCSNSKFFEDLGWDGLLIEPNPSQIPILKTNRDWEIIQKAVVSNSELSFETKFQPFPTGAWGQGLAGIPSKYHPNHIERILFEEHQGLIKNIPEWIDVETVTVKELFSLCPSNIDILSLDIEGNELEILKSINFENYTIKVITVENNYYGNEIQDFMISKNFNLFCTTGCDEIYFNKG